MIKTNIQEIDMKALRQCLICLLWLVPSLAVAHADDVARIVKYSRTDIIPIRAKVRFSTLIVLPADEEILDFTTGDKDFWIINGAHNLCYLHPAQTGIRTNLNLVTSGGRVYSFLLTEISKDAEAEPDLKVFVTPSEHSSIGDNESQGSFVRATDLAAYKAEVMQVRNELAEEVKKAHAQAAIQIDEYKRNYPAKLQFDYAVGKNAQRPPFLVSSIYHDDRFTYIKSSAVEKPTLYELKDKKPSLVNFDFSDGVYIVQKIIDNGYMVVGKKRLTFSRHGN